MAKQYIVFFMFLAVVVVYRAMYCSNSQTLAGKKRS